jgi:hypothetical protein
MPRIALPIAVLMLALAASAGAVIPAEVNPSDSGQAVAAQGYRSTEARTVTKPDPEVLALAQDYRSADAQTAAVTTSVAPAAQDVRSPDGGRVPFTSAPVAEDLRSPDGGPAGGFGSSVPATAPAPVVSDGGSFAWGYLAAAIAAALLGLGALLLTYRRHHHGLAPGH